MKFLNEKIEKKSQITGHLFFSGKTPVDLEKRNRVKSYFGIIIYFNNIVQENLIQSLLFSHE